jgi:signal transduction histidine kinase
MPGMICMKTRLRSNDRGRRTVIHLATTRKNSLRTVSVLEDDGPGIPAQFHDQIFKMFRTLKPGDQVEGSRMGLAMVRKNIEVFGGMLNLESSEGKGSIFRFTWPKRQTIRGEDA